jgi:hypothetical protein
MLTAREDAKTQLRYVRVQGCRQHFVRLHLATETGAKDVDIIGRRDRA